MTRSTPTLRRAPALVLLILPLAAVGCGGGGDAAADPTTIPAAADGPAGPEATMAVVAAAARTDATPRGASTAAASAPANPADPGPTTAVTGTTIPPTTVRPTSASTAPTSSASSASTANTTGTTGTTLRSVPSGQPMGILAGTVMASPTCPVERPDQPCPPRPVAAAHVEVFDRAEQLVTTIEADAQGRFVLGLSPGRYVLTASFGSVFPSCPPFTVQVPTAGQATADILCDSGIR